MKKFLVAAGVLSLFVNGAAFAQDGYINYQAVIANYADAQKALRELDNKSFKMKQYIFEKEQAYKNTEAGDKRKAMQEEAINEIKTREAEFAKLKASKEQELSANVKTAIQKVRESKKLDMIFDASQVYAGGVDCTGDVINLLNAKK